jgi:hypothetical protein
MVVFVIGVSKLTGTKSSISQRHRTNQLVLLGGQVFPERIRNCGHHLYSDMRHLL